MKALPATPTSDDANKIVDRFYASDILLGKSTLDVEGLTGAQKKEMAGLFDRLLKKKIFLELPGWNAYFKNCSIGSVKKEGLEDRVIVKTMIEPAKAFEMVFIISKNQTGYKIADFEMNGVLLSRNFRGQFNRIFNEEGYAGIVARLTQKLNSPLTH
ncbi:ABC transporter substrate-binding protein [bacterium]|nr:ABC transporter substrate-binding protein [bacterium]